MPERMATRKVETPNVQGPDSYVMLRPMTVGEVISLQQEAEGSTAAATRLWLRVKRILRIKDKPQTRSQNYATFARRVLDFVADWNWVGDHGEPLPNPRECPDVVRSLTDSELLALTKIVYGTDESDDIKN